MADTMQLLTAASTDMLLRDQKCKSGCVTRRQRAIKPVASTVCARSAKGFALALAVIAGISAATRSAAANDNPIAFITPFGGEAVSMTDSDMPLILDHSSDVQTVDPDPATQFHGKAYRELGAEPVPIPHPNARAASSRPGRGGLGVPALPNLPRLWQ